MLANCNK